MTLTDTTTDSGAATGTGIQISGVSKSFDLRGGKSLLALQDTDLHTDKGSFLALLGPSGCGKSTILRILAALDHPTTGSALVDGQTPDQLRANSELGIAFQDHALLPWRSIRKNIELPFEVAGRTVDKAYVDELIALVGLSDFANAKPAQLSGGMRQRASVARAVSCSATALRASSHRCDSFSFSFCDGGRGACAPAAGCRKCRPRLGGPISQISNLRRCRSASSRLASRRGFEGVDEDEKTSWR